MRLLVLSLLEVGHDAVHAKRLGREKVESFDIAVGGSALSDLLDVWSKSGRSAADVAAEAARTGDVLVQNGILFHRIVEDLLAAGVDDQHFPL